MKEDKKLGQESAFPVPLNPGENYTNGNPDGMSKRFYAACAAMQGLITRKGSLTWVDTQRIVRLSYVFSDELLKQENDV
jgi:hypothetical protein